MAMVLARQCLALQFFKNGQNRYVWAFQNLFSRKPDAMESFTCPVRKMLSETPEAILFKKPS